MSALPCTVHAVADGTAPSCFGRTALLRLLGVAALVLVAGLAANMVPQVFAAPNTHLTPDALAAAQAMLAGG